MATPPPGTAKADWSAIAGATPTTPLPPTVGEAVPCSDGTSTTPPHALHRARFPASASSTRYDFPQFPHRATRLMIDLCADLPPSVSATLVPLPYSKQ